MTTHFSGNLETVVAKYFGTKRFGAEGAAESHESKQKKHHQRFAGRTIFLTSDHELWLQGYVVYKQFGVKYAYTIEDGWCAFPTVTTQVVQRGSENRTSGLWNLRTGQICSSVCIL